MLKTNVFLKKDDINVDIRCIPFLTHDSFYPSGLIWGDKYIWNGTILKKRRSDIDIYYIESNNNDLQPAMLSYIAHMPHYGLRHNFIFDYEKLSNIEDLVGQKVQLCCDLSEFKTSMFTNFKIIYHETINKSHLKNEFIIPICDFLSKSFDLLVPNAITLYCFESSNQKLNLTNDDGEGFAYKNKYVGFVYDKANCSNIVHELTHIFLYQDKMSVFLFREGIATLMSDKYIYKNDYTKYSCHKISKNYLNLDKKCRLLMFILRDYDRIPKNNIISGHYFICASFLSWLENEYGFCNVLGCYRDMTVDKTTYNLVEIFKKYIGISIEDAEKKWRAWLFKK